jgi:PilZ domain
LLSFSRYLFSENIDRQLFSGKLNEVGFFLVPWVAVCLAGFRIVGNLIYMDDRTSDNDSRSLSVRDRRFCIRYPFAADAVVLDMESGARIEGVTSDLSIGGVFICTSKPLPSNTRIRVTLTRRDQKIEALGMVRIVKPRIGMGVEFIDVESPYDELLGRWVEQLSKAR